MTKKKNHPTISYSFQAGPGTQTTKSAPPERNPRVLIINAIPDDNRVTVEFIDQRGFEFHNTGNFKFPEIDGIDIHVLFLGGRKGGQIKFGRPDFAINLICDPDSNARGLEAARELIARDDIPTLNPPDRIAATKRDLLYQRFADFEGILVPKTIRLRPRYCRDVRVAVEQGDVRLPFIFRPAGQHGGKGMTLVREPGDIDEMERFAFDGRDYYLTEFVDCRDPDGFYRKFRVIAIDGRLYPRHLFTSDQWMVHRNSKQKVADFEADEKDFLEHFRERLGERNLARLEAFSAQVGLDYFGMDLNLRPDGSLVMFETNACMYSLFESKRDNIKPFTRRIGAALREMIFRRYRDSRSVPLH